MIRTCGVSTALLAFSVTVFRGLAVGNPTETILARALWSLLIFLILGLTVAWIGQTVVEEYSRQIRERENRAKESEAAQSTAAEPAAGAGAGTGAEAEATEEVSARIPEGAGTRAG